MLAACVNPGSWCNMVFAGYAPLMIVGTYTGTTAPSYRSKLPDVVLMSCMASKILYLTASDGTCFWQCLRLSRSDCKARSDHAAHVRNGNNGVCQSIAAAAGESLLCKLFVGHLFAERALSISAMLYAYCACCGIMSRVSVLQKHCVTLANAGVRGYQKGVAGMGTCG